MNRYINIEYENDNYRLINYDEKEFDLLDLNNGTFKTLEIMWHTTLSDILDFVVINCDEDFIVGYLNNLLNIVDEDEEKEMIKDILKKYRN